MTRSLPTITMGPPTQKECGVVFSDEFDELTVCRDGPNADLVVSVENLVEIGLGESLVQDGNFNIVDSDFRSVSDLCEVSDDGIYGRGDIGGFGGSRGGTESRARGLLLLFK